jgi:hypothetical protein
MEQLQDEMRSRVTECVRAEQTCQRQQTELKTLKERNTSYEEEIDELKRLSDKIKRDLMASKEEAHGMHVENGKLRANVAKANGELEASQSQMKLLYEQLAHNDALLQQAHAELRQERGKQQECQRVIAQLKQSLAELNNEADQGDKQRKELLAKASGILISKYLVLHRVIDKMFNLAKKRSRRKKHAFKRWKKRSRVHRNECASAKRSLLRRMPMCGVYKRAWLMLKNNALVTTKKYVQDMIMIELAMKW